MSPSSAIERDQQHVVHGRQRPDQERDAEHHRGHLRRRPAAADSAVGAPASRRAGDAHSCTSLVWSVRIRMIAIGISTGRADITAATPSDGLGGVEGVVDAERGQHVRGIRRRAFGNQIHGGEIADRPEGGEQRADQIEVPQQREDDVGETAAAAGSVYVGRFIDLLRDRHPAGEEGQRPERHPFPDVGDDVRSEGEPAVIEPERAANPEQRRQDAVDETLLADQHPVEGDERRNRRERPGQNEDGEQRPDPPAATHEEAGQQQGQEHLHVHAEADEQRRIDDRPHVERVGDQVAVERRLPGHPEPVGDGIDDEGQEHRRVGDDEGDRPGELRAVQVAVPGRSPRPVERAGLDCENLCVLLIPASSAQPDRVSRGGYEPSASGGAARRRESGTECRTRQVARGVALPRRA